MVSLCTQPHVLHRSPRMLEVNCRPLSDTRYLGTPQRVKISSRKIFITLLGPGIPKWERLHPLRVIINNDNEVGVLFFTGGE